MGCTNSGVKRRVIADWEKLERLERDLLRRGGTDHAKNLAIANAMWEEAAALGVFPLDDPMQGIEVDLRIARAVNSV